MPGPTVDAQGEPRLWNAGKTGYCVTEGRDERCGPSEELRWGLCLCHSGFCHLELILCQAFGRPHGFLRSHGQHYGHRALKPGPRVPHPPRCSYRLLITLVCSAPRTTGRHWCLNNCHVLGPSSIPSISNDLRVPGSPGPLPRSTHSSRPPSSLSLAQTVLPLCPTHFLCSQG